MDAYQYVLWRSYESRTIQRIHATISSSGRKKGAKKCKSSLSRGKTVYRSYVRLGRNSIQALWDMGAQISVCTKPLAIKLGFKWTKLTETTNMVTVNGQKSLTLEIMKNTQLKIIDTLVSINIHIVDSTKEELLIGSN